MNRDVRARLNNGLRVLFVVDDITASEELPLTQVFHFDAALDVTSTALGIRAQDACTGFSGWIIQLGAEREHESLTRGVDATPPGLGLRDVPVLIDWAVNFTKPVAGRGRFVKVITFCLGREQPITSPAITELQDGVIHVGFLRPGQPQRFSFRLFQPANQHTIRLRGAAAAKQDP
jgi:hypothetical protein